MRMNRLMQVTILAAAIAAAQGRKDDPEVLLRAAIEKESVDGDLKAAIQQYEKIARGGNRAAAAKALVRMGQCYEKLGDAEARKAYERAVRDFADQKESVATARSRLVALGGPREAGQGVRNRLLWDNSLGHVQNVSADGRWVPFGDAATAGIGVRNLTTGEARILKKGKAHWEGLDECLVSPDGTHIAYLWWQWEAREGAGEGYSFRIMRTDGTGERVLFEMGKENIYYFTPLAWSADGKWIAGLKTGRDTQTLLLVSVEDGRTRVVHEARGFWPNRAVFSPDGRWLALGAFAESAPRGRHVYTLDLAAAPAEPKLVSENSVLIGLTPRGDGILYNRPRHDTQEMFLLPVASGKPAGEPRRLSETPEIDGRPLGITSSGALLYEKSEVTADGILAGADLGALSLGRPAFLRPTASLQGGSIKFSPDGKKVLLMMPRGALLIRSLEDGSERTILPQVEAFWIAEWTADGASLIVNANGKDGNNGLYRIDPQTGAASPIVASGPGVGPFGRFALTPDGKSAYYRGQDVAVAAVDLQTGALRTMAPAPRLAFQEMRVSPDGSKAATFGENRVIVIDLASGTHKALIEQRGIFHGGDWSPDGRFLFTTFGEPGAPTELLKIPVEGGTPVRVPLPEHYRGLRLSPDGKTVALTRWNLHRQVWALENFLPRASR